MNNDIANLVMRLTFGLTMAFAHGWGKLANFGAKSSVFPDPLGVGSELSLGLAVFAEFFCALLVAAGLFTRMASIPLIITMLVACFMVHGSDPFSKQELSFLYMLAYGAIFAMGSGKYSLQGMLKIGSNSKVPFMAFLLR